jgi:hypothetical protein
VCFDPKMLANTVAALGMIIMAIYFEAIMVASSNFFIIELRVCHVTRRYGALSNTTEYAKLLLLKS